MNRTWAAREADEPVLDWLLRLRISTLAVTGQLRLPAPALVPALRGCGTHHEGTCTSETERTAS